MTDRLAEIRALLAGAPHPLQDPTGHVFVIDGVDDYEYGWNKLPGYKAMIAAAPELLAWCVAEIERLRGDIRSASALALRLVGTERGLCRCCGRAHAIQHDGDCPVPMLLVVTDRAQVKP